MPCALIAVLRYALLTAIATLYQFTDVTSPQSKTNADMPEVGGKGNGFSVNIISDPENCSITDVLFFSDSRYNKVTYCALSVLLRYPLLTAIATRYQFTDVAMPPIIETSEAV